MASVAKYNTRVVQKHDTKANWDKATNFIPLAGEIIIYDDLGRFKIGDGVTKVGSLPFANSKKSDVGLGNVDNTSDDAKPVSSAQQAALDVASTKVRHSRTATSNFRPVILHSLYDTDYGTDPGAATDQLYYNEVFAAQPSTGTLKATTFEGALKGNADTSSEVNFHNISAPPTGDGCYPVNISAEFTINEVTFPQHAKGMFVSTGTDDAVLYVVDEVGEVYTAHRTRHGWQNARQLIHEAKSYTDEYLGAFSELFAYMYGDDLAEVEDITDIPTVRQIANDEANKAKTELQTQLDNLNWSSGGTSIPSGSSLNDYKIPGKYTVDSVAIAETITNAPITSENYTLYVIKRTAGGGITQIIITLNAKVFLRSTGNDVSFSKDWKQIIDSDNIGSQSVASATKATQDGSGNVIVDTYATKAVATTSANGLMSSYDKDKLVGTNIAYATCSTSGSTQTKQITIVDNDQWSMNRGSRIIIKFTSTNTASNPKFCVNNRTDQPVMYNGSQITTSNLNYAGVANRLMEFVFDGTYFVFMGWSIDNNTTYTNASLGQGYATCSTAAATTAKVATLSSYSLATGGIVAVKFTYAVPASATLNVNSKGAKSIYYKGAAITANVIKAGDIATFIYNGSQYHLISIDRWQSDIESKASIYIGSGDMPSGYNMQIDPNGEAFSVATYTVNVPTGWTTDTTNGGYYKTIAVTGIKATDNPIADVLLGSNISTNAASLDAWSCVTRIVTAANSITLYANEKAPTVAFSVQLKVVS